VAGVIRRKATTAGLDRARRKSADEAASYLTKKARYLDYPTALNNGWPIATGVIEGACCHIVADRLDITGARWESKAPKRSSNSGRYAATKTSTPTGSTTWPKNAAESTSPDTPIASSRKRPDVPPREPHPIGIPLRDGVRLA